MTWSAIFLAAAIRWERSPSLPGQRSRVHMFWDDRDTAPPTPCARATVARFQWRGREKEVCVDWMCAGKKGKHNACSHRSVRLLTVSVRKRHAGEAHAPRLPACTLHTRWLVLLWELPCCPFARRKTPFCWARQCGVSANANEATNAGHGFRGQASLVGHLFGAHPVHLSLHAAASPPLTSVGGGSRGLAACAAHGHQQGTAQHHDVPR